MRLGLLGPLELRDAEGLPVPVTGARRRALLGRLALDPGRVVTTDRLVDDLWGTRPPSAPVSALRSAVSRLRRDLDRAGPPGRKAVGSPGAGYRLDLSPACVDLHEFERLTTSGSAAVLSGDADRGAKLLRDALGLWRGPVLADAGGAPFVAAVAARAGSLRLSAIEARVDADLARGVDPETLVTELTAACAEYPLREGLAARLIRALTTAGRRADALERYAAVRRFLVDRLGVDPGPEVQDAHLAALREDARPRVSARRGNLPAALTGFVGRSAELRRVAELLAGGRLITLTGPGGAGKTRLALEAAAVVPDAPDGVWLVEPAGHGSGATVGTVAEAVLATLARPTEALEAPTAEDPVTRLVELLGGRRALLVFDNGEHVVEALAALVTRLLDAAPGVRALVTGREPLGVAGEALCPIPPLPQPLSAAGLDDARGYPSVQLFTARASAAQPGFALTGTTVGDVVRICRTLDGLPLAIELAAAWLRSLRLGAVASRLDDRFALLSRGSRRRVPPHRTLRAVLDGSWELMSRSQRTLLRRLAVFAGATSLEAVDVVCGTGLPPGELPDLVGDLVDRSLLVPADGPDGRRYRLPATVRAYAADRLDEAGEREHVAAAHTTYLLTVAEHTEPLLRTGEQRTAIARFQAWHADLDAATARAVTAGQTGAARRLVAARLRFWWLTGQRPAAAYRALLGPADVGHTGAPEPDSTHRNGC
ncbi:BTAD domain-containing putative transcriptional regulator [Cryptosporangium aurantiacum]|uniref:Predicted ATPase n=1 Tax=Cryptosporangium aurantiacum TaxID=134849 RepID=A0A1M7RB08_9ACTN|nr:BTAD domain-containing putative transcriptional regulator [Cryptosporangium aurantiacum]SHN43464.1 Predicted ATPase [Cryptosporangium aurantiacum]